ncbi:hypothetical protein B9Z55_010655 [Caenorhabditis nigoni]|uniref:Uncharacterized protein n=1 Tax=Caenorhabditis nigoni TaxID=1611254 RepID=A0A2G5UGY3_9PELO|nr:hypothetical protein B9Z55_010655 [Caenorhabditis nigoni]
MMTPVAKKNERCGFPGCTSCKDSFHWQECRDEDVRSKEIIRKFLRNWADSPIQNLELRLFLFHKMEIAW